MKTPKKTLQELLQARLADLAEVVELVESSAKLTGSEKAKWVSPLRRTLVKAVEAAKL